MSESVSLSWTREDRWYVESAGDNWRWFGVLEALEVTPLVFLFGFVYRISMVEKNEKTKKRISTGWEEKGGQSLAGVGNKIIILSRFVSNTMIFLYLSLPRNASPRRVLADASRGHKVQAKIGLAEATLQCTEPRFRAELVLFLR